MSHHNYIETRRNDPPCYICCRYLHTDNDRMFFKDVEAPGNVPGWKRKISYHCHAGDLESLQFGYPSLWSTFFRVIVHEPNQPHWWLSGIAQFTNNNTTVCYVPKSSSRAVCGRSPATNQQLEPIRISEFVVQAAPGVVSREVYPIHMRCWELVRSLLGSSVDTNLGLLVNILRNGYQNPNPTAAHTWGASDPVLIREKIDQYSTSDPTNILTYGLQPNAPNLMHNMTATQWRTFLDNLDYDKIRDQRQKNGIPQGMQMQSYFRDRARASGLFFELDAYPVDALNWEDLCRTIEKALKRGSDLATSRTQITPILNGIKNTYGQDFLTANGHPPPP